MAHQVELRWLTRLNLDGTRVTAQGLQQLHGLWKLTILSLPADAMQKKELQQLRQALPECWIDAGENYQAPSDFELPE